MFYGEADLSYGQPGGCYHYGLLAYDHFNNVCPYLYHQFWYIPTAAVELDFDQVDYGSFPINIWKWVGGDYDIETPMYPTLRNIGTAPVNISIWQDDMGLGKTIVNGIPTWNVLFASRLSGPMGEMVEYAPFENDAGMFGTHIPYTIDLTNVERLDFSINVKKGYPDLLYTGLMKLYAYINKDNYVWDTPVQFVENAPGGVPQIYEGPNLPVPWDINDSCLWDDENKAFNASGNQGNVSTLCEVEETGPGDPPIVKCKWETPDDEPFISGTQINPCIEGEVNVSYYAIVTDPQGVSTIDNVYADVYTPYGNQKFSVQLDPVGFTGGSYDKIEALNIWDNVVADHMDLVMINEDWAINLPPEIDPIDDIYDELWEEMAYLFHGYANLSYLDPAGNYSVNVSAFDNFGIWCDPLQNQFLYMAAPAIDIDFSECDYGGVSLSIWKWLFGDWTMYYDYPTIENVGNVPVCVKLWQDDMGLGKTGEAWNVMFAGRVGNEFGNMSGSLVEFYPEQEVVLPDVIDVGESWKISFGTNVLKGLAGTDYYGSMHVSAVQSEWPYNQANTTFTIDTHTHINNESGNIPPVVQAKWETPDDNNNNIGTQIEPVLDGEKKIDFWAIASDQDGLDDLYGVYADVYDPEMATMFSLELSEVVLSSEVLDMVYDVYNSSLITFQDGYSWSIVWQGLLNGTVKLYSGTGTLQYNDQSGNYTVNITVLDDQASLSEPLINQFYYVPIPGIIIDFSEVYYGSVDVGTHKMIGGDKDMFTTNKPTVKNIGNVPVQLIISQDDLGLGKRYVQGQEEWNVEFDARLSADGEYVYYKPNAEGVIPTILQVGEIEKLDFSIPVSYTHLRAHET